MSGKFVIKEMWSFLKTRKLLWLIPTFIVLIGFGILLICALGSNTKIFAYELF